METTDPKFRQDRDRTYDAILQLLDAHIEAIPVGLVTDIHTSAPSTARNGAMRESWRLFQNGIRHLKNGAPGGEPGSLPGALEKITVRRSSLASGLGVKPPAFEASDEFSVPEFESGREEALFFARRLVEAAMGDLEKSRKTIGNGLATQNPADAFGVSSSGPGDAELAKIFEAVMKSKPAAKAQEQTKDVIDMRRQTVMTFNFLMDAYGQAGETLLQELDSLPQGPAKPKPPTKGQSFDF